MGRLASGVALVTLFLCAAVPGLADPIDALRLEPRPARVSVDATCTGPLPAAVLRAARLTRIDPGGRELLEERWRAIGVRPLPGKTTALRFVTARDGLQPRAYRLTVAASSVLIEAGDSEAQFDALVTLAQLARAGQALPCVRIADEPALRWRILSDDVSRGPLPTMRYFEERIRTIAAFKMNGYSPYMEHVFVDVHHPLPAPLDGITADQLRRLAAYASRFHVALIPEQQTFAHMHQTLRFERYAPLAELPHGYLLAPANPNGERYVRALIRDELAAIPHPPFFHLGSDEPADLGRGLSAALVAQLGVPAVFAQHVRDAVEALAGSGARPMIWDDAVQAQPEIFGQLPKSLVLINWHYGNEKTFEPYIRRIANAGFDQMVAPGVDNWNEIYPDLDVALTGIDRFVTEGKQTRVLGLFQTVWHDDGETLYEATWYPVLYAAASAWERSPVDRARFTSDFPHAFFASDDLGFGADLDALAHARTLLQKNPRRYGDVLFWADPFAPDLAGMTTAFDIPAVRLSAESAIAHLRTATPPPLHANAAGVMLLAAMRYDVLGRGFQIAREARDAYAEARAQDDGKHDGLVFRDLFLAKYLMWERRDALLELAPLVQTAWEYESRSGHEASVLEHYRVAADRAIERADRLATVTARRDAERTPLPSFEDAIGLQTTP